LDTFKNKNSEKQLTLTTKASFNNISHTENKEQQELIWLFVRHFNRYWKHFDIHSYVTIKIKKYTYEIEP